MFYKRLGIYIPPTQKTTQTKKQEKHLQSLLGSFVKFWFKSLVHLVTHFSMRIDLARPTAELADSVDCF